MKQASALVSRTEEKKGMLEGFVPILGDLHYIGSVAYKLGKLATGTSNLYFTVQPKNEWDVCAGELLIREAGGEMLDLNGQERHYNQPNTRIEPGLVAGNKDLTSQALNLISKIRE